MDWNRIEVEIGKQTTGKIKEKWGKLTDAADDLTQINGKREQF